MRRKIFLITLSLVTIFSQASQALASSDTADDIPLLTKRSKAQTLIISPGNPDIVLGPNIDKYIKYCSDHNLSCDLGETLWHLASFKHNWNSFRVNSMVSFHIPDEFIQGIFDDLQSSERVVAIKALIKQSAQREQKEAEEAKAAAALNKSSVMDLSSFSSSSLLNDSSSSAVASVMIHQSGTTQTTTESCAATHDSQLRQRKVQSTLSTIPSH